MHVRKEIDGFIADRLMEAMWRESLHLIDEDVATAEELDDAIRFGAGLRWSFMGNFLIYRIAGGEQGMRHFMAQFGPALKLPWTKLEAPELTDGLLDKIVAQSDEQAGSRSIRELERLRDDCLIAVMQGLQAHDWGAGQVLKQLCGPALRRGPRRARHRRHRPGPAAGALPDPDPGRLGRL